MVQFAHPIDSWLLIYSPATSPFQKFVRKLQFSTDKCKIPTAKLHNWNHGTASEHITAPVRQHFFEPRSA